MKTPAQKLERSRCQPRLWQLAIFFSLTCCGLAQPTITRQPMNASVSLGATAQFRVYTSSASPLTLTFQWRHEETEIAGAVAAILSITNVQALDAGNYTVVVFDSTGSVTSQPALLDVDPTFTRITSGDIVTDKRHWHGQTWGDYDNDGDLDLFILSKESGWNPIYRNNRDGTFTRILEPTLQGKHNNANWLFAWVDYDNDGHLDLFLPDFAAADGSSGKNLLLRNTGNGTFVKITDSPITRDGTICTSGAWGDYDRDGDLDLVVANGGMVTRTEKNWFYQNQGQGLFVKLTNSAFGPLIEDRGQFIVPVWIDADDDGGPDLFITDRSGATNRLYRNTGEGAFTRVAGTPLVEDRSMWGNCAWSDYDNDGDLDVFVTATANHVGALYRNDGAMHFKRMTAAEIGPLALERLIESWSCAWGDYDNDGWLDLFVASGYQFSDRRQCLLYRNQGDGTFAKVTTGSPANDVGAVLAAHWVDYDQDGFLDLFCSDHDEPTLWANRLFRNNGNAHAWLEVKCVGTVSPRWGTGAKVHVKTTIRGKERWQLRLIDAGGTCWGGQSFEAHFGLGDATEVDTLRIEWPSGIVQELRNVAARQILTVTEPPRLEMTQLGAIRVHCWKNQCFAIESSTDLHQWQPLSILTNATGTLEWNDTNATKFSARFYRAVKP